MRLKLNFFQRHYQKLHHRGRVHIYKRPYLVPVFGLLVGLAIVGALTVFRGGTAALRPTDSHVVYIFDSGKKQTIDTHSDTVGELVKKLPLNLIPEDVVEPSLDTKIVEDNFRINIYRARPVTVIDNNVKTVTITAQRSPRVAAQDAGVTVYPEDKASFASGSIQNNTIGEEVLIDRATPIAFTLYGTPLTVRTHSKTVGDLLKEKNIKLTSQDTLTPGVDTPLTPNMQVSLVRNGTATTTVEEAIDPPIQYVSDPSLSLGATAVRQQGTPGKRVVTYQVVTQNGKEVSRTILQSATVQDPVPQIIARGAAIDINGDKTSIMAAAGIAPGDYGYVNYIVSHESGWCPTKAQGEHYCPDVPDNAWTPNGYGLCQATPGYKMATAGADWQTNPLTQLRWCSSYASRYGGWGGAYEHWIAYHWW